MVLENVIISLFSTQVKYYKFQLQNSKSKTLFSTREIAANLSYKIQNHRRYLNVSRNIII